MLNEKFHYTSRHRSRQLSSWLVPVLGFLLECRGNYIFSRRHTKIQEKHAKQLVYHFLLPPQALKIFLNMPFTHQEMNIRRNWKSLLCHHTALTLLLSTSLQKSGSTFPSTTGIGAHFNVPQAQPAQFDIKLGTGAGISPGAKSQLAHLKWFWPKGNERGVFGKTLCVEAFPMLVALLKRTRNTDQAEEQEMVWTVWGVQEGWFSSCCGLDWTGLGWAAPVPLLASLHKHDCGSCFAEWREMWLPLIPHCMVAFPLPKPFCQRGSKREYSWSVHPEIAPHLPSSNASLKACSIHTLTRGPLLHL